MSKTAKSKNGARQVTTQKNNGNELMIEANQMALSAAMNTMRILKRVNPGDAYYENYLGMIEKYKPKFYDVYQLLWAIGIARPPKRILEIGTRTGISLCQLLSAMSRKSIDAIESITCVDPFDQWTSPNLVRANLKYLNLPDAKPQILAMKSEDWFKNRAAQSSTGKLEPAFDYILVDGDHSKPAARADLEAAGKLVESDGIIVFDDISNAEGECGLIDMWNDWKAQQPEGAFSFYEVMQGKGVAFAIKS